ncbi:HD domain-containing phosphohydrolase [Ruania zhangjianzhongii]|uniref:HD domain-containing phosphohydrolase n=1 Tax=Ruania zhangjianzhongii TaxID=2603206 RepID=UPI0011CB40B2|nr:HD domain-containing phosphohydrolase [Ruania zhangjianzhongii]
MDTSSVTTDPAGGGQSTLPRRVELLAALSLAIDLGLGQPMEHMLRAGLLGMRLADELGLSADQRDRVFYATLLSWLGCHVDSHELTELFGDDIDFRRGTYTLDKRGFPMLLFLLRRVGSTESTASRLGHAAGFLATGRAALTELIRSHCSSAGTLAERVGVGADVGALLGYAFERWDGAGLPRGVRRDQVPIEMRVVHLAETAEVYLREGGCVAAEQMVRRRRGSHFDPDVADRFCARSADLTDELLEADTWTQVLRLTSADRVADAAQLDQILAALGDFADLKSPYTAGHSRRVSYLAETAAEVLGLPEGTRSDLRRAGSVHDLGRMGVSNAVWDKSATLTDAERERVRLHPYLSERILIRVSGLTEIARIAGAHHERLDGSGYPRGVDATGLDLSQRILAAADSYCTWREDRPHRAARTEAESSERLRKDVIDFHLDPQAVEAVLTAAGNSPRRRTVGPAGLTTRELEVLRLLVRGRSTREMAGDLVITEKTARHHLEHIYVKLGVSNRVSATLFALDHGLVGPFDPPPPPALP